MKVSILNSAGGSFCWNYAADTLYSNYAGVLQLYCNCIAIVLQLCCRCIATYVAIMQVLKFYCNYEGGTFYFTYVGNDAGDSFCCNLLLEVSAAFMQVKGLCSKYVGDTFY